MQIFTVREIQLFIVHKKFSLIILKKQGSGEVLTQIMTFINHHRHGSHNISKLIA